MSALVHKEVLYPGAYLTVGGRPIAAGIDPQGQWAVWFITGAPEVVTTSPTGHVVPPGARHLDTFVDPVSGLVIHAWVIGGAS